MNVDKPFPGERVLRDLHIGGTGRPHAQKRRMNRGGVMLSVVGEQRSSVRADAKPPAAGKGTVGHRQPDHLATDEKRGVTRPLKV